MNEHANLVILFIIAKLFEYNVHKSSLNEGKTRFSPPYYIYKRRDDIIINV